MSTKYVDNIFRRQYLANIFRTKIFQQNMLTTIFGKNISAKNMSTKEHDKIFDENMSADVFLPRPPLPSAILPRSQLISLSILRHLLRAAHSSQNLPVGQVLLLAPSNKPSLFPSYVLSSGPRTRRKICPLGGQILLLVRSNKPSLLNIMRDDIKYNSSIKYKR